MKKRVLSLLLALVMTLSLAAPALAAEDAAQASDTEDIVPPPRCGFSPRGP